MTYFEPYLISWRPVTSVLVLLTSYVCAFSRRLTINKNSSNTFMLIGHNTIRETIGLCLCAKKLTGSQLKLLLGTKEQKKIK